VVVACYLCVIAGVLGGLLPLTALLVLLTLPIAYVSIRRAMHDYANVSKIVASSAATIQLYIVNGLLLCTAYALSNWL